MSEPVCKGCGRKIVWASIYADGIIKHIPLDPSAPTYEQTGADELGTARWERSKAMVSHFATCPNADQFSGKRGNMKTDKAIKINDRCTCCGAEHTFIIHQ